MKSDFNESLPRFDRVFHMSQNVEVPHEVKNRLGHVKDDWQECLEFGQGEKRTKDELEQLNFLMGQPNSNFALL